MESMPMTDQIRCYRPLIAGRRGATAANHPLAAQAGLMALRAGGNAADAAVATALTLGVVEPMMSGLGGDAFYHVFDAKSGKSVVFNGTGPAPRAATPERYAGGIPRTGPLSVSVPGMLAGLEAMHREYGTLAWAELCTEAIRLAREGFGATPNYRHFAGEYLATIQVDRRSIATFLRDGAPPPVGTLIVQPDLARTLEEIAADGAETFYRGALARRLATALPECGTLVTQADLAEFQAETQQPIGIDYRGFRVLQAPPNSTGFVVLQELKIAENFDLARMALGSADLVHVMVEAKRLAFADRERWGSDPRTLQPPFDEILSADYCARLAARIDMRHAAPTRSLTDAAGDTTYFCTADGEGNAVSGIQSINSGFGSGVSDGWRHRYPPQQPHGLLAPRPGASEPSASRPTRAPHDEPAAGAEGRGTLGCFRHAGRRQSGADQFPDRHRDDRFRPQPAAGGRDAALDLDGARPIRQLPA